MRIIDFFDRGANLFPENIAFLDATGQCSYREVTTRTHMLASALDRRMFGKGVHIGILAPNSNIAFLVLLGVLRAGAVWLPLNPRNPIAVNSDLLARFDCELLLFHSVYEEVARKLTARAASLRLAVCIDGNSELGDSLPLWMREATPYFPPGRSLLRRHTVDFSQR